MCIRDRSNIDKLLLEIPNTPHKSVPIGKDENNNVVIRSWGEKPQYDFDISGHVDIAENLKLLDFKAGSKISGSGFPVYTGLGSKLERSLINFMLDQHTNNNYTEIFPPFLVTEDSMRTTGQLPKFIDDMYQLPKDDLF